MKLNIYSKTMFKLNLFVLLIVHRAQTFQKCCDPQKYLSIKENSTSCLADNDRRIQIYNPKQTSYSFNTTFECVDIVNQTTVMKLLIDKNRQIVTKESIDVNFYTKCCPLGNIYNSVTHSCLPLPNSNSTFIKQHFVKIGLPKCRIIADFKLNHQNYRFEMDTLIIENKLKFKPGDFCLDHDENDEMIARGCYKEVDDVCHNTKCLHKCCPDGHSFINGNKCVRNGFRHGMEHNFQKRIINFSDPYALIHNHKCKLFRLKEHFVFHVDEEGSFWIYYNITNVYKSFYVEQEIYCIEHAKRADLNGFQFFMCKPQVHIETKILVTRWIKILSCISVALTIFVYLIVPDMMNLFGKILISYCLASFCFYTVLTYNQFDVEPLQTVCEFTGFLLIYSTFAQYTWLNVMCINIYRTFGSNKILIKSKQKRSELKKFLLYSVYGWGLPLALCLLIFLMYSLKNVPFSIRPYIGKYKCFFDTRIGNYAMHLYLQTPLVIIVLANLILFLKTIMYCLKIKKEIQKLNDNRIREKRFNCDKDQLGLILKLSIVMGISFVFEMISAFYDFSNHSITKYIEIVWDSFNCAQGLFIFIIFVCKKRVLTQCCNKFRTIQVNKRQTTFSTNCTTEQETLQLHTSNK